MRSHIFSLILFTFLFLFNVIEGQNDTNGSFPGLCIAPGDDVETRWISPENPSGEKGKGGLTNKGAKGNAFYIIPPGEKKVIFDVKGAGMINRMWFSGTIANNPEQRRAVRIDMFWDEAVKPAVSAPIGDFFGIAHGLVARYDNELFSSPEARSFNFTIPMPFRKSAYITINNESGSEVWFWYDINYLKLKHVPVEAMYFHAYWSRNMKTTPGEDFTILPEVKGRGRYLGTNIGVIGNPLLRGTWFGEGEVKIYVDGDSSNPTMMGTGTEDYIGSGWGQGEYTCRYFGSPVADRESDIYAFYRYHIADPVYFHDDCRVTIQQMGNTNRKDVISRMKAGSGIIPVWYLGNDSTPTYQGRLLGEHSSRKITDANFPDTGVNFYRSDDVCATAYFYLTTPENNLPPLVSVEARLAGLKENVWDIESSRQKKENR